MAIKTFTTGEVLTSSDTNTYLANSGLVYVASGALSGVATNFAGCFSSTYDNYRVVCGNYQNSNSPDLVGFRMLSGTTPASTSQYYTAISSFNSSGTVGSITAAPTTLGYFIRVLGSGAVYQSFAFDIMNPFVATTTALTGMGTTVGTGGNYTAFFGGIGHDNAASYNGLQILTGSGSYTMAGTVSIYGYRKA